MQRGHAASPKSSRQRAGSHRHCGTKQANTSSAGAISNLMIINDPNVIAELNALYPRYEHALVTNDVDSLVGMFWDALQVTRFGVSENLYGTAELEAFRKAR